jgi:hypothetical protein
VTEAITIVGERKDVARRGEGNKGEKEPPLWMVGRVPLTMPATFTNCSAGDRTRKGERSFGVSSLTDAHSTPSSDDYDILTLAF